MRIKLNSAYKGTYHSIWSGITLEWMTDSTLALSAELVKEITPISLMLSVLLGFILQFTALVTIIHRSFTLKSKIISSSRLVFSNLGKKKYQ